MDAPNNKYSFHSYIRSRVKRLIQNPDNRIFFSKGDPNLIALETLEKTYTKNDNIFILIALRMGTYLLRLI